MNLKNKTDKELWDMLEIASYMVNSSFCDKGGANKHKYDIHQEIIKREKDSEILLIPNQA